MSYTRQIGNMVINVNCAADPETNYNKYYEDIKRKINADGYIPETTMENLISMSVLYFDNDDNYGEYDPETGFGGYGDGFTLDSFFRFIDENGWSEFDYYC